MIALAIPSPARRGADNSVGSGRCGDDGWPAAVASVHSVAEKESVLPVAQSLLQRVAAGDPGAVQAVLDQYGGLVWSLARRFSANQSDAEDAVQEIFLDVWKSAARYDPGVAGEATFISMIARRRLIDRNRRAGRQPTTEAIHDGSSFEPPSAERAAETGDDAARAARAFKELSQEQQRVLRLSIFHGLSHEKISAATGLPLGTVKTHARRGLIRIREILDRQDTEQNARQESVS